MTTQLNVHSSSPQNQGILMSTMARKTFSHPSLASGIHQNATTSTNASPGAVLGTGDNSDTYTPGIEAV